MSTVRAALVAFGCIAALVGFAPPASAATDGPCPTADGVTVVVDAASLGGTVTQRCATGTQQSGLSALANAGYVVTPVTTQGALVCRIDGLPGSDSESCFGAPPLNAYWSYFRAERGGSWTYSTLGAHTRPISGGVEGWVFFSEVQRVPGIAVPAAFDRAAPTVTPTPTPTPTPKPTPSKKPKPEKSASPNARQPVESAQGSGGSAGSDTAATTTAGDATLPSASPTKRENVGYATSQAGEAAAVVPVEQTGGSLWSTVVGVGILLGLVATVGVLQIRRRRSASGL